MVPFPGHSFLILFTDKSICYDHFTLATLSHHLSLQLLLDHVTRFWFHHYTVYTANKFIDYNISSTQHTLKKTFRKKRKWKHQTCKHDSCSRHLHFSCSCRAHTTMVTPSNANVSNEAAPTLALMVYYLIFYTFKRWALIGFFLIAI